MGNVHKDNLGSRRGCEVEAHFGMDSRVCMAQECGPLGHRSCVEQEQGREGKMEEAAAGKAGQVPPTSRRAYASWVQEALEARI